MAGRRQVAPGDLVNRRGDRGRGMRVPGRSEGWEAPALPVEVAEPRRIWLPGEILEAFVENYGAGIVPEGMPGPAIDALRLQAARQELERIATRAQELTRQAWERWWRSTPSLPVDPEGEAAEPLRRWIVAVFEIALFAAVVQALPLVKGARGYVRNPLESLLVSRRAEVARVEREFGMTTASRFHLHFEGPGDDEGDDDLERAMRGDGI